MKKITTLAAILTAYLFSSLSLVATETAGFNPGYNLNELNQSLLTRAKKKKSNSASSSLPISSFHVLESTGAYFVPTFHEQIPLPVIGFPATGNPTALLALQVPANLDLNAKHHIGIRLLTGPSLISKKGKVRFTIHAQIVRPGATVGGLDAFTTRVGSATLNVRSAPNGEIGRFFIAKIKGKSNLFQKGDMVLLKITRDNTVNGLLNNPILRATTDLTGFDDDVFIAYASYEPGPTEPPEPTTDRG